jgi:hypothetical protein
VEKAPAFDIEKVLADFPIEALPQSTSFVKFFDHYGLDVLLNGEIKVTPSGEFNDPFELSPRLPQEHICPEKLRAHLLSKGGFMWLWWSRHCSAADERQYTEFVERCVAAGTEKAFEWLKYEVDIVKEVAGEHWGICCFSAFSEEDMRSSDAIRHWAFYARDHAGIAIQFDGSHAFFKKWLQARLLFSVRYKSDRAVANLPDFDKADKETEVRLVRKWAAVKSSVWGAEKEWRWVFPLDDTDAFPCRRVVVGERIVYLRRLWAPDDSNAKMVRRVILGCRSSNELKKSIHAALNQPHLRHVELWQAFEDKNEFRLGLERVG